MNASGDKVRAWHNPTFHAFQAADTIRMCEETLHAALHLDKCHLEIQLGVDTNDI